MIFKKWFSEFLLDTDWSDLYDIEKSAYFKTVTTDLSYWAPHLHMLEKVGIDTLDMNAEIIDIGIWFGILPYALNQFGFKNVSTTERFYESSPKMNEFKKLWNHFSLDPFDFEVFPGKQFSLPKTYDLITIFETNMLWKTRDVLRYDGNTITSDWQTTDANGNVHTYFSPYKGDDLAVLVDCITNTLRHNGKAIIHPRPWVYNLDRLISERNFLSNFQKDFYAYPDINALTDYFVVVK